jgi:hypothetical protein
MSSIIKITVSLLVISMISPVAGAADDLKAFYEKQKAEIAPTFVAPQLGSEVNIKLAAGQPRSGILMKLTADSIALMTDTGMVTYKRTVLHESSRAIFFAEDYAHVKALEKTREYKQQLYMENMAETAANMHEGRISVSAKVDKSSDKEIEENEQENEKTGDSRTTTITTRTYTDIQNLQITISNNTTHPDTYTLAWYFFGKSVESDTVRVHDSGTRKVTVGGRKREQEKVSSNAYVVEKVARTSTSSNSNSSGDARISESGEENAGWLVLLKYGNEIMDKKASAKTYMSEEWLRKVQ